MLSLMVLDPAYLPKLYLPDGKMTGTAEAAMLVGAVAAMLLGWLLYRTAERPVDTQLRGASLVRGLGRVALLLVAVHVACIGWAGWFDIASWPGGLPPITLISFAAAVLLCALRRPNRATRID
jgi:hypothetical protein